MIIGYHYVNDIFAFSYNFTDELEYRNRLE